MVISGTLKKLKDGFYIETKDEECFFVHSTDSIVESDGLWELSEKQEIHDGWDRRFVSYSYKAVRIYKSDNRIIYGTYHESCQYSTGGVGYIECPSGEKQYVARVNGAKDGATGKWIITSCEIWFDIENKIHYYLPLWVG